MTKIKFDKHPDWIFPTSSNTIRYRLKPYLEIKWELELDGEVSK